MVSWASRPYDCAESGYGKGQEGAFCGWLRDSGYRRENIDVRIAPRYPAPVGRAARQVEKRKPGRTKRVASPCPEDEGVGRGRGTIRPVAALKYAPRSWKSPGPSRTPPPLRPTTTKCVTRGITTQRAWCLSESASPARCSNWRRSERQTRSFSVNWRSIHTGTHSTREGRTTR
jgi:hypothetical protein